MNLHQGRLYNDDRLFILDLTQARKGSRKIWTVVTRRNHEGFPPIRVDEFATKEAAIAFIREVEPTTPRISLGGSSPVPPPSYERYCQQLRNEGIPSAMEICELNRGRQRDLIVEPLTHVQEETPINAPPAGNRFLYNYAHIALRILALGNPRKFYKDVSSRTGTHYLLSIWQGLGRKMGVSHPPDELALSKIAIRRDTELFIIRMPRPKTTPEAFYIGVAFRIKRQLLKTDVLSVRYFTLELGRSIINQSEEYHFCEWTGALQPEHHNYGRLPISSEQVFVRAVESQL